VNVPDVECKADFIIGNCELKEDTQPKVIAEAIGLMGGSSVCLVCSA
jgi:hypothetical protein